MAEGAWTANLIISSILSFGTGSALNALMLFLSFIALVKSMTNPLSSNGFQQR
jgi:hypothetical protein